LGYPCFHLFHFNTFLSSLLFPPGALSLVTRPLCVRVNKRTYGKGKYQYRELSSEILYFSYSMWWTEDNFFSLSRVFPQQRKNFYRTRLNPKYWNALIVVTRWCNIIFFHFDKSEYFAIIHSKDFIDGEKIELKK